MTFNKLPHFCLLSFRLRSLMRSIFKYRVKCRSHPASASLLCVFISGHSRHKHTLLFPELIECRIHGSWAGVSEEFSRGPDQLNQAFHNHQRTEMALLPSHCLFVVQFFQNLCLEWDLIMWQGENMIMLLCRVLM